MKIFFDTASLYYLPQYMPIYHELTSRGHSCHFVFYNGIHDKIVKEIIEQSNLQSTWVASPEEAILFYEDQTADWVFFANTFGYIERLHQVSKSVQLGHGIGPKASYYTKSSTSMTVRFVEGQERLKRFNQMYPNDTFVDVGFSKLDPIINGTVEAFDLPSLGLDDTKKTILYAPTFYPSSIECFPKNWPESFKDYNILIKPHYFSLSKSQYKKQKKRLEHWSKFNNVYLADVKDYNLVPFLATADLLISDASSALFEFAVLDKPVVWCDFLKLRWNYRWPFSYRFKRRMDQDYGTFADIAVHVKKYSHLKDTVIEQLEQPELLQEVRLSFAERLAGNLDGQASSRIVSYLEEHTN